jgi:hypothetical protein
MMGKILESTETRDGRRIVTLKKDTVIGGIKLPAGFQMVMRDLEKPKKKKGG